MNRANVRLVLRALPALLPLAPVALVASLGSAGGPHPSHIVFVQRPSPVAGQPQQPTFRVQVEMIRVDVIATDSQDRFVKTLVKDDFELLEDGKPQEIATFDLIEVPLKGATQAAASSIVALSDVRTNTRDVTGRVYLIILDDLRTPFEASGYTRAAASRFVQNFMEPGDTAAVALTSGRRTASQEFTADRRRLLASIDKFSGGQVPVEGGSAGGLAPLAEETSARSLVNTLTNLAESLGGTAGRKSCLYLGPGFAVTASPTGSSARFSTGTTTSGAKPVTAAEYRQLVASSNRANVSFYTLDPRGLAPLAEGENIDEPHEGLRWLAVDTGGLSGAGSGNLDRTFDRIRRDNSAYYLMGYYPTNRREGTEYRIAVKVRRPGIAVRARTGYSVPRRGTRQAATLTGKNVPPALLLALDNPLPSAGIRFSMSATPFNGTPRNPPWVSVVVEIDGRDLDLSGKGVLNVGMVAVDALGSVRGHDIRRVDLALDPASLARVREAGLRVQARVPIEGEVKALRVAVADGSQPRVGSLSITMAVPDFHQAPLSMSGVLLSDGRAAQTPTTNADSEFGRILGGPATTRREFRTTDVIRWVVEIYQKPGDTKEMRVTTSMVADDGRVMFRHERDTASDPRNARGGITDTGAVPLENFPPGAYVLRIESQAAGAKEPVSREVALSVAR